MSDPTFHKENLKSLQVILEKNNFPKGVIQRITNDAIHKHHKVSGGPSPTHIGGEDQHVYVGASFVPGVSTYMNRLVKRSNSNLRLGFSSKKNVGHIFTKLKDRTDKSLKSNVVYEIPCKGTSSEDCNLSYIGTTKQYLKNRVANHKNDINAGRGDKSALAHHCVFNKHRPGLEDVKILCTENNFKKRMILESLHIQASENVMNIKQDAENVHRIYGPLVANFTRRIRQEHPENS